MGFSVVFYFCDVDFSPSCLYQVISNLRFSFFAAEKTMKAYQYDPEKVQTLIREARALRNLAKRMNDLQHAGLEITPGMWSNLYHRTNSCTAALEAMKL
jgi:abortive infection bacteriophage resistance protein